VQATEQVPLTNSKNSRGRSNQVIQKSNVSENENLGEVSLRIENVFCRKYRNVWAMKTFEGSSQIKFNLKMRMDKMIFDNA